MGLLASVLGLQQLLVLGRATTSVEGLGLLDDRGDHELGEEQVTYALSSMEDAVVWIVAAMAAAAVFVCVTCFGLECGCWRVESDRERGDVGCGRLVYETGLGNLRGRRSQYRKRSRAPSRNAWDGGTSGFDWNEWGVERFDLLSQTKK